jgi:hypothetical protein
VIAHECKPNANPRYQSSCSTCGRLLKRPEGRQRNVALEQELHRSLGVDPVLASFADERCHPGAISNWENRDFIRDATEEVADYLNYLTWELQRLMERRDSGERFQAVATALRLGSEAFLALRYADSLSS